MSGLRARPPSTSSVDHDDDGAVMMMVVMMAKSEKGYLPADRPTYLPAYVAA